MKITQAHDTIKCDYMGIKLTIARHNNDAFKRKFRALLKPHTDEFENDTMNDDVADIITAESLAGTVLVGFESFMVGDDQYDYSVENAESLMRDDEDCREFVMEKSRDLKNFLMEEKASVAGKPQQSLSGVSTTEAQIG